ncbi:MAG: hypothetical protein AMXMBFR46_22580 [Acidimicrobiia bacterium]
MFPMSAWGKRIVGAGLVAGALYALWRVIDERSRASRLEWSTQPFPSPPKPSLKESPAAGTDDHPPASAAPAP